MRRRKILVASLFILLLVINETLAFAITPKELLNRVNEKTKDVKDSVVDIRMSMSLTGMSSGSGQSGTTSLVYRMKIESIINPPIVRMTYIEPDTFKGTVMLIDTEKKLMSVYSPVTNQVVQSKMEDSQTSTLNINVTDPTSLLQDLEKTYDLAVEERKVDKKDAYVLTATLKPNQKGDFSKGIFYFEKNTLNPIKVELFDTKGQPMATIEILSMKYNAGLKVATLRSFPKDAKIVKGGTMQGAPGLPFGTQSNK